MSPQEKTLQEIRKSKLQAEKRIANANFSNQHYIQLLKSSERFIYFVPVPAVMLDALRWGYTFLLADGRLTAAERLYLVEEATEMYLKDEEERAIRLDSLEGRLYTKGQHDSLGHFGGQRFDAELDTSRGRVKLRFLVSEQTGEGQKSGYVN